MKRIISLMLVAMLLVGCLSTVAFAAGEERTATVSYTISGHFMNLSGEVVAEGPLVITAISGVTGNPANGVFKWADAVNADQNVTVKVTVKLPAGEKCGDYSVKFSGSTKIGVFDENGSMTHTEKTGDFSGTKSVSFEHSWGEWVLTTPAEDCQHKNVYTATCDICGATKTMEDGIGEHSHGAEWKYNDDAHWHECACGDVADKAAHTMKWTVVKDPTYTAEGLKKGECTVCDYEDEKPIPKLEKEPEDDDDEDDVVDMGDITPYGFYNTMIAVVVVAMVSAVVLVFKRKTAK